MLRELVLGLAVVLAQLCHISIKTWGDQLSSVKTVRRAIITNPNQALKDYCARPGDFEVYFRTDGKWLPACTFGPEYRHRGRRYWRLIVSSKYEILGSRSRTISLEWKLLR